MIAVIRGNRESTGERTNDPEIAPIRPQSKSPQPNPPTQKVGMPKRVSSPLSGGGNLRFRAPSKVSLKKSFLRPGKRPFWIYGKKGEISGVSLRFFPPSAEAITEVRLCKRWAEGGEGPSFGVRFFTPEKRHLSSFPFSADAISHFYDFPASATLSFAQIQSK